MSKKGKNGINKKKESKKKNNDRNMDQTTRKPESETKVKFWKTLGFITGTIIGICGIIVSLYFGLRSPSKDDIADQNTQLDQLMDFLSVEDIESLIGFDEEDKEKLESVVTEQVNGKYDEAFHVIEGVIDKYSDFSIVFFLEGNHFFFLAEYSNAIESYDIALVFDAENTITWNNKGLALYNLTEYNLAIECYDKALTFDPKNLKAWNNKGLALHELGEYESAIECYDKALAINPEHEGVLNNKGLTLYELGEYESAID